jgi:hypothetical protein
MRPSVTTATCSEFAIFMAEPDSASGAVNCRYYLLSVIPRLSFTHLSALHPASGF